MAGTGAGDDDAVPAPPDRPRDLPRDVPRDLPRDAEDGGADADPDPDTGGTPEPVPFEVPDDIATRVANARTRHGRGGAMLAAGMLGLDAAVNGRKPREEIPVVVDAAGEPVDVDRDGIRIQVGRTEPADVPHDPADGLGPGGRGGDAATDPTTDPTTDPATDLIEVIAPPLPRRAPVVSPAPRGTRRRWR